MPLRLIFRENSSVARRERAERAEKAVADGFRTLAALLSRAAELIEARRLERHGYERQGTFLERSGEKGQR